MSVYSLFYVSSADGPEELCRCFRRLQVGRTAENWNESGEVFVLCTGSENGATMAVSSYSSSMDEWDALMNEFEQLEKNHDKYLTKLMELTSLQNASLKAVKHHNYRVSQIKGDLKRLDANGVPKSDEEAERLEKMRKQQAEVQLRLSEMQNELPVENNGLYLSVILGSNLPVSLLNKADRYKYKQEYEKFKMNVTCVLLVMLGIAYAYPTRAMDAIVNGSRIKGWWVMHHYASCVLCGITLTWKDGICYQAFRHTFLLFSMYIGTVQILQNMYQSGCLRRLHALGQRHAMDVTVEGFSSWMFKGLTFLIPFLVVGYILQFYCAYVLFDIYRTLDCTGQWQVIALAILFFLIACGNMFTILRVIARKIQESKSYHNMVRLTNKYRQKYE
uniref:Transmembrane protein 120 homolog n=1 Tax=Steinernema glaseri TaxID=37863 RepID=A0A1I8AE28_9BILA